MLQVINGSNRDVNGVRQLAAFKQRRIIVRGEVTFVVGHVRKQTCLAHQCVTSRPFFPVREVASPLLHARYQGGTDSLNKLREGWIFPICFSPGKTKSASNPVSPKIRFLLFYNFPRIIICKVSVKTQHRGLRARSSETTETPDNTTTPIALVACTYLPLFLRALRLALRMFTHCRGLQERLL